MSIQEDQFLESLRETFKVEASEHLESIANGLLALQKPQGPAERQRLVETVFRAAHSLKGAARAVNFNEIESVCQAVEDVFAAWKRGENIPSPEALEIVHQSLDAVSRVMADTSGRTDPALHLHAKALRKLSTSRSRPLNPITVAEPPPVETPALVPTETEKAPVADTVRVAIAKLDARLLQAEEMLAAKLVTSQHETELRDLVERFQEWKEEWTKIQPSARAVRQSLERSATRAETSNSELQTVVDFIEWTYDHFRSLESRVATLNRTAAQDSSMVGKMVDDLIEDSKKLLMLPMSTLSGFLQRLVRDLCRNQGKQAELVITGDEVEMDRRILEAIKDPLMHIIRNCVDHGLETPERRQKQGKSPRATIRLSVTPRDGEKVELVVADDGAGIDLTKVRESAIKQELTTPEEAERLSDEDALSLVFKADVSTSPMITQLSGRGLGLAIVREQTEKLGGVVSIQSTQFVGTTIRITLPITLRTFRGVLVRTWNQLFVTPSARVERVARFKPEDVQTVEGKETLTFNGRPISLVRLGDVLELTEAEHRGDGPATTPVLILGSSDQQVAFSVDEILDEQEVLVKRLGKPLSRVRNIAGATVLGSGQVAPILNVEDLLKSARGVRSRHSVTTQKAVEAEAKSILVVEDSITSRMLLKGILESAGYQVKTAVDGIDAFTILRTESFDLVVSDVEMPRLNGFDLTSRIRADKKLKELPVILVTALETREDRERGVDVGASAYLIKSSFDQSNLLEAVRRLA
jgi:two-component system, chemotaxis family, sensor kinase CheA